MDIYKLASVKANEIEGELKRLNRWCTEPLSPEKFENMGAFGSNTMPFEHWLQFILIPRIHAIVRERGEFPTNSNVATYAIRVFDGDPDTDNLQELLYALDNLINEKDTIPFPAGKPFPFTPQTVTIGDTEIPSALRAVIEVFPMFSGTDLESQLQTVDIFLSYLSPLVRPALSTLIKEVAQKTLDADSRKRIEQAADAVACGGRAAGPYEGKTLEKMPGGI